MKGSQLLSHSIIKNKFTFEVIVHAYTFHDVLLWQDGRTPVLVRPPFEGGRRSATITIRSCQTVDVMDTMDLRMDTPIQEVIRLWCLLRGVEPERVTIYFDHKDLSNYDTLEEAGVYDGAYMFGVIRSNN